jgi:hypothetical protein
VLAACGDVRARQMLYYAHAYVLNLAADLGPDARARYLTAVAANRAIMELWQAQGKGAEQ